MARHCSMLFFSQNSCHDYSIVRQVLFLPTTCAKGFLSRSISSPLYTVNDILNSVYMTDQALIAVPETDAAGVRCARAPPWLSHSSAVTFHCYRIAAEYRLMWEQHARRWTSTCFIPDTCPANPTLFGCATRVIPVIDRTTSAFVTVKFRWLLDVQTCSDERRGA